MKQKFKTIFLLSIAHCIVMGTAIGQVLTNNGAQIFSNTNALIFVDGEVLNQNSGTFDNSGTIELTGDWTNNSGNAAFIPSTPGIVLMSGAGQSIQGNDVTQFYDLTLSGTGIKSQNIDAIVENTLNLNDRELATQQYTMYIINPSVSAITRTGSTSPPYSNNTNEGFVSSDSIAGTLSRVTNSTSTYLFPVGSSFGTVRFRPIEITPNAAVIDAFTSRMANIDATTEGFDRSINDSTLCIINPVFYHNINNIPGNSADITIYFDDVSDNNYTDITHWQNVPRWENTGVVAVVSNGSPVLSSVTKSTWNDYSYTPFALGTSSPIVTLSSNNSICQGDSITFFASAGFTNYDFYNNSNLEQSGPIDTFATSALTTGDTIRVTATDAGCTAYSNEIIITVSPPPVLDTIAMQIDSSSCGGSDGSITLITISGTAPFTYDWFDGSSTVGDSLVLDSVPAGSYTLTVTDSNGCTDVSGPYDVYTMSAPPAPTAFSDTAYCDGDAIAGLTAAGSNIEWFSDAGLTDSIGAGSPFTPAVVVGNNTFYVTQTVGNCQSPADSVIILINSLPVINTSLMVIDSSSCGASDGSIDSITVSGTPSFTYDWFDGSSTVGTSLVLDSVPAGSYTLTVTDSNGCSDVSGPHIISDVGAPLINISAINIIPSRCDSGTGEINGITATGGIPPLTYEWDDPDSQDSVAATGLDASSYILTVTDSNGCSAFSGPHIVPNFPSPPAPTASSPAPYCQGDVIADLTASGTGGVLIWYSNVALTDSVFSGSPFASGATSDTSFWVTETNNGCEGTATQVNITISPAQTAIITPSGSTTFCSGDSVELISNPAVSYEWFLDGISMGLYTQNIFVSGSGNYQVVINGSGCSDTSAIEPITVNPAPIAGISASSPTLCGGDAVTLTASGGGTYLWNTGDITPIIIDTPPVSATYWVIVSNGTCSDSAFIGITVINTISAGPDQDFCTNTAAGYLDTSSATPSGGIWSSPDSAVAPNLNPDGFFDHLNIPWGTYVIVYSIGNCSDTAQIDISGSYAPSDKTVCPVNGKFTLPDADPAGGSWDGPGIVDATTGEVETNTLTIGSTYDYIYTNQGCPDTMRVTICEEYEYFIPEVFSPNNDMINDILYVRGKGIDWMLLRIYDRWGEMVFESTDINVGWDGKYRGKQMNAGVFVYLLEVTFLNGELYEEQGDITLVR